MKTFPMLALSVMLGGGLCLRAADTVELNGFSCLPGEKLACLVLYQPALTKPIKFLLAEGESRYGFKLLEVDAAGRRVLVEQCGFKKYVRIGSAPELVANPAPVGPAVTARPTAEETQAVASYLASEEVQRIRAGKPLWPGAVLSARNVGAGNGGADSHSESSAVVGSEAGQLGLNKGTGASSGLAHSSVPSGVGNNHVVEPWYQDSLNIEQSRANTAADVLAGSADPLPQTPLTPQNTPSQLVSREIYFSNRIPGFHVIGFLN